MRSSSTRDITLGALACALVAVFAVIPKFNVGFLPVPITLQNLAVLLVGLVLPRRAGFLGLLAFVLLVATGVPLLSGGRGGIAVLYGPSAGYIWGWVVGAPLMAWTLERFGRSFWTCLAAALTFGVLLDYVLGIPASAFIGHLPLGKTVIGSMVFVPGDVVKSVVASVIAVALAGRLSYGQDRSGRAA